METNHVWTVYSLTISCRFDGREICNLTKAVTSQCKIIRASSSMSSTIVSRVQDETYSSNPPSPKSKACFLGNGDLGSAYGTTYKRVSRVR